MKTLESSLLAQIRLALGKEPDLVLWRNAVVSTEVWDPKTGRAQHVQGGLGRGTSDLVGILSPMGRFFALEVKTAEGRLSEEQELWLALVRRRGGFAAVVRSVPEAHAALARARKGAHE